MESLVFFVVAGFLWNKIIILSSLLQRLISVILKEKKKRIVSRGSFVVYIVVHSSIFPFLYEDNDQQSYEVNTSCLLLPFAPSLFTICLERKFKFLINPTIKRLLHSFKFYFCKSPTGCIQDLVGTLSEREKDLFLYN
jgi:hypothetical protein